MLLFPRVSAGSCWRSRRHFILIHNFPLKNLQIWIENEISITHLNQYNKMNWKNFSSNCCQTIFSQKKLLLHWMQEPFLEYSVCAELCIPFRYTSGRHSTNAGKKYRCIATLTPCFLARIFDSASKVKVFFFQWLWVQIRSIQILNL